MEEYNIATIDGDGIGPKVSQSSVRFIKSALAWILHRA